MKVPNFMQTSFKGHIVTRQGIINALHDFDRRYATTEAYTNWLSRNSRKFLVRHGNRQYPPKLILSLVTGVSTADFTGGKQTNCVFTDLGFEVAEVVGVKPPPSTLSSLASQMKSLFSGKKSEPDNDFEEPVIPGFSVRNSDQESDSKYIISETSEDAHLRVVHVPETVSSDINTVAFERGHDDLPPPPPPDEHQDIFSAPPTNWSQVPVTVLTDRLARRGGGGAQTARIIGAKHCRTVADVMKISDDQWLRHNGYGPNALSILHEEVAALLATPASSHTEAVPPYQGVQYDSKKVRGTEERERTAITQTALTALPLNGGLVIQSEQSHDIVAIQDDSHDASPSGASSGQSDTTSKTVTTDWSQIPVTVLTRRLGMSQDAKRVISAISEIRCRTMADIIEKTDEQWLSCRDFRPGSLSILREELAAVTAMYLVSPSYTGLMPTLGATALPLDDPYWYPRVWSELTGLFHTYGAQRLAAIPVAGLVSMLRNGPVGAEVADIIAHHCNSMVELLASTPSTSSTNSYLTRLDSVQLRLLKVTVTDYLRAELRTQLRDNKTGKFPSFPVTEVRRTEPSTQVRDSETGQVQISPATSVTTQPSDSKTDKAEIFPAADFERDDSYEQLRNNKSSKTRGFPPTDFLSDEIGNIQMPPAPNLLRDEPDTQLRKNEPSNMQAPSATHFAYHVPDTQLRNREIGKTQVFAATNYPLHDNLDVHLLQSGTLWEQIQDKLRDPIVEHLKLVLFSDVANSIQNVRARNALLRRLPSDFSLYDLVMMTEDNLLGIRNFGVSSLDALKLELVDVLNRLQMAYSAVRQADPLSDFAASELVDIPKSIDISVDDLDAQSIHSSTLWEQIRDKLRSPEADILKSVLFRDVARSLQDKRVRNALLRHLSPNYSLHNLLMSTKHELVLREFR